MRAAASSTSALPCSCQAALATPPLLASPVVTRRGSIDWLPDRWQTVLAGGTTPYAAAGPGASGAGAGALPGYRRGLLGLLPVAAAALYGTEEVHAAAGEDSEDSEGSKGAA